MFISLFPVALLGKISIKLFLFVQKKDDCHVTPCLISAGQTSPAIYKIHPLTDIS